MLPGVAKAGIKTAGTVKTQHTLTILANTSEGQTREITGCEHDGQMEKCPQPDSRWGH